MQGHPSIIGFIGYVIADAMAMVTEFAPHGNLLGQCPCRGVFKLVLCRMQLSLGISVKSD